MDIAIVTGASSSLGLAISRRLIQLGFRVYGLGGDYSECPLQNVNFRPVPCNLADPNAVEAAAKRILEKENKILVLVNNAKYFGSKSYLEMPPEEMQRVLNINLLTPLILSRTFAEGLMALQGFIIQLGPLHMESNRGGPTGAASAGGLKWMSELLFQDLREYGVRVCHLSPEPNRGRDPRTTQRQGARVTSAIDPEAVAQALEQLLQSPFGNIVTEMVIRPLRVREPEHDPVVKLPYPKPKPVPYTIPREMIEAEEQLEEEEFRKKEKRRRAKPKGGRKSQQPQTGKDTKVEEEAQPEKDSGKKRRPPRKAASKGKREPAPEPRPETDSKPEPESSPAPADKPADSRESDQRSGRPRRSRRKPRPPKVEVGFLDRKEANREMTKPETAPEKESASAPLENKPAKKKRPARKKAKKPEPDSPVKTDPVEKVEEKAEEPARKTAAKKSVPRKTAAKKATKKAAAKKAARKATKKATVKKKSATKKTARKTAGRKAESDAKSD